MSTDAHQRPDIPMPNDATADRLNADAYTAWHRALEELTGDQQRFDSWRKRRYAFAHRVGIFADPKHIHRPLSRQDQHSMASISLVPVSAMWGRPRRPSEGFGTSLSERVITWPVTVPPELWTRVIVVQRAVLLAPAVGDHDGQSLT